MPCSSETRSVSSTIVLGGAPDALPFLAPPPPVPGHLSPTRNNLLMISTEPLSPIPGALGSIVDRVPHAGHHSDHAPPQGTPKVSSTLAASQISCTSVDSGCALSIVHQLVIVPCHSTRCTRDGLPSPLCEPGLPNHVIRLEASHAQHRNSIGLSVAAGYRDLLLQIFQASPSGGLVSLVVFDLCEGLGLNVELPNGGDAVGLLSHKTFAPPRVKCGSQIVR